MVVCKFYIQGYCKFGSRCRYDHVGYGVESSKSGDLSTSEKPIGVSVLKGGSSSFSGYQQLNQSSAVQLSQTPETHSFSQKNTTGIFNVQEVIVGSPSDDLSIGSRTMITRDVMQAAKGSQWQLSCYSPARDLPNVPGLDDYSPEEMRWESYKALSNGTLPLWQATALQLLTNVKKRYSELHHKDHLYALVDGWLRKNDTFHVAPQNVTPPFYGSAAPAVPFNHPPIHAVQPSASSAFTFSLSGAQVGASQIHPTVSTDTNLFATNTSSPTPMPHPFGSGIPSLANDSQAYSRSEDLTEEDYKAFQADRFTIGKIPTKPPTVMFCNV